MRARLSVRRRITALRWRVSPRSITVVAILFGGVAGLRALQRIPRATCRTCTSGQGARCVACRTCQVSRETHVPRGTIDHAPEDMPSETDRKRGCRECGTHYTGDGPRCRVCGVEAPICARCDARHLNNEHDKEPT